MTAARPSLARLTAAAVLALLAVGPALTQDAWPRKIPASGGEVVIPSESWRGAYEQIGYAPARRVGDTLYVSGMIIGRAPGEGTDAVAFEAQTRRAFAALDETLRAGGAGFDDVVIINSFHVWEGEHVGVTPMQQIEIMNKVRADYATAPHPAWTAVGTTGLLSPTGVVEVQLIAHVPER